MNEFSWFGNIALTVDNKLGVENEQTDISNHKDFQVVHEFRNKLAAIGVGSTTILVDNPSLRTKSKYLEYKINNHPIPIIFDRRGRIPLESKVFQHLLNRPVIWITDKQFEQLPKEIDIVPYTTLNQVVNRVEQLLRQKHQSGGIMIEGGRLLMTELINAGIIKHIRIFTSNFELPSSSLQFHFNTKKRFLPISISQLADGFERIYFIK